MSRLGGTEGRERKPTWRDELPPVREIVHPSLLHMLQASGRVIDRNEYHIDHRIVIGVRSGLFKDFTGNIEVDELVAELLVISALSGRWAEMKIPEQWELRLSEGKRRYNSLLKAEEGKLLVSTKSTDPGVNRFVFVPTAQLIGSMRQRLNGDMPHAANS